MPTSIQSFLLTSLGGTLVILKNNRIADFLDAAADYIVDKGWIQKKFRTCDGVCADEAIASVTTPFGQKLYEVVVDAFRDYIGRSPMGWNDILGQTEDKVIQTFRDAAMKYRDDC